MLDAQKIKEESFDHASADEAAEERKNTSNNIPVIDFNKFYELNNIEASIEACKQNSISLYYSQIIYLLNVNCWNDVQEWAKNLLNHK